MRLGFLTFKRRTAKELLALDDAALKKIVAVSDEYWLALYKPVTDVVVSCVSVFDGNKSNLLSDYADQFVRLVRRSKGGVQDDPLLVHLYTFGLVVSFSVIYVSRLASDFEFHAISSDKKTAGDRTIFFPWFNTPSKAELKIRKAERVFPAYVNGFTIINRMVSDVGWKWLLGNKVVLKAMIDAIYTNGESGVFSGVLAEIRKPSLTERGQSPVSSVFTEKQSMTTGVDSGPAPSIDDLINNLGGGEEFSLDDLLSGNAVTDKAGTKPESPPEAVSTDMLDLSVFDSEPLVTETPIKNTPADKVLQPALDNSSSDTQPEKIWHAKLNGDDHASIQNTPDTKVSADDALDEFQAFLNSVSDASSLDAGEVGEQSPNDEVSYDFDDNATEFGSTLEHPISDALDGLIQADANNAENSLLFSNESSLASEFVQWCCKKLKFYDGATGLYPLKHNNVFVIAVDIDAGIKAYVNDDYDLENDSQVISVAEEVHTDIAMSSLWIPNSEGGEVWTLFLGNDKYKVILVKPDSETGLTPLEPLLYQLGEESS